MPSLHVQQNASSRPDVVANSNHGELKIQVVPLKVLINYRNVGRNGTIGGNQDNSAAHGII